MTTHKPGAIGKVLSDRVKGTEQEEGVLTLLKRDAGVKVYWFISLPGQKQGLNHWVTQAGGAADTTKCHGRG